MGVIGKDVYTICAKCAEANGATWPDGHLATFSVTKCQVCAKERSTCDVSDWNWPKGKRPATFSMMRRD